MQYEIGIMRFLVLGWIVDVLHRLSECAFRGVSLTFLRNILNEKEVT